MTKTMEKIVALAKNRGFVFQGSEIYGGLANTWDYGHLGVELKGNVQRAWWKKFVQECPHNVGIESSILMNPSVWVASGHVVNFNDPLIDCRSCKMRFRADQLIEAWGESGGTGARADGLTNEEMAAFIIENGIACQHCGKSDFTPIRKFNMMFKTFQGVTEDSTTEVYLRPETAQGMFVNFQNAMRAARRKVPFGIAQVGKAFRNEITPGNFTFRTREFEQMELEFFCEPGKDLEWFRYWRSFCLDWLKLVGIKEGSLRLRDHAPEELSHYSKATTDIEYLFPFGWGELWGIADRTDYDLRQHIEHSKADLTYFDPETKERYVPYCIEPSLGLTRMTLAIMCEAYDEEVVPGGPAGGADGPGEPDVRTVMRFHPAIAPVKAAVLPLSRKLGEGAQKVYAALCRRFACEYDDTASIGKRYRRQDEIGTPYCVTYDFDSAEDGMVTVRERDGMGQVRVPIEGLGTWFEGKFDL